MCNAGVHTMIYMIYLYIMYANMSSVRSGAKIWRSAPGLAFGRGGSRGAAATSKTHGFLQGISWDRPNLQTTN